MRIRVVLVDDDEDTRFLVAALLVRRGFEVDAVASAHECLLRLEAASIHVVVTDVEMPVMNGIELCRQIRERFPAIALIIMTGLATPSTVDAARELGVSTLLSKPVSASKLESAILQAVRVA